jgi:P-type conjugative transfer protein TrbJ
VKSTVARLAMIAAALGAFAVPIVFPATPAAAIPVFDPTNYAQNLLQAARALEQINNQVRSLQNEATMIRSMEKNLQRIDFPEVGRMTTTLQKIDQLMGQARGIDFNVDQLDAKLKAMFPGNGNGALSGDAQVAAAKARLEAAQDGFRRSMAVQAQVVENVRGDAALLADLSARSQNAEGSLQAAQATNQLLALTAKQQLQLQSLMAAEFREASLERARRAQAESDGQAATRRFLGPGKAYTPQ